MSMRCAITDCLLTARLPQRLASRPFDLLVHSVLLQICLPLVWLFVYVCVCSCPCPSGVWRQRQRYRIFKQMIRAQTHLHTDYAALNPQLWPTCRSQSQRSDPQPPKRTWLSIVCCGPVRRRCCKQKTMNLSRFHRGSSL